MNLRRSRFCLSLAALLFFFRAALASQLEVYVFGHPFTASVVTRSGKMYVPAEPLAKAMNLPVERKNGTLWVGTPPQAAVNTGLVLNGKPFADAFEEKDNRWMVALKPFVEAAGDKFALNQETQIIDILPGGARTLNQAQAEALIKNVPDSIASSDFLTYRSAKYGAQMKYPKNWEKIENFLGAAVAFRRPKENDSDTFLENLNLIVVPIPPGEQANLQEYNQTAMSILKTKVPSLEVLETGASSTLAGHEAGKNVYTQIKANLHLKGMQLYSIIDGKLYVFTYTASEKNYDKSLPVIQSMIDSFTVSAI